VPHGNLQHCHPVAAAPPLPPHRPLCPSPVNPTTPAAGQIPLRSDPVGSTELATVIELHHHHTCSPTPCHGGANQRCKDNMSDGAGKSYNFQLPRGGSALVNAFHR
jgi:hypothetical protein